MLWLAILLAGLTLGLLSEMLRAYGGNKAALSVAVVATVAALAIWRPQRGDDEACGCSSPSASPSP